MIVWVVISIVFSAVTVTAAVDPLPRKVVLSADNLEILRLDIMAMEVRLSKNMKEQSDRVVAALDRYGAKLDESGRTSAGRTLRWRRLWNGRRSGWICLRESSTGS